MAYRSVLLLSLALANSAFGHVSTGRAGHGLIGFGIEMYKPGCAHACRSALSNFPLNCTPHGDMNMPGMSMAHMPETGPECYATDDAFLQSLAYCIHTRCQGVPAWELEKYWRMNVAGRAQVQPDPKETYQQALEKAGTPTETLADKNSLNKTSKISDAAYISNYNGLTIFEEMEVAHEKYGIIVIVLGFALPVLLSFLRFVPWPQQMTSKFNAVFIDAPLFGRRHKQPIGNIAHVPTRGQALFIFYMFAVNIILSSVSFRSRQPNFMFKTSSAEITAILTNRTGVLSFANLPLVILYAGRNNILLKLTNWSHGTFLLLHRWLAFICTLQACLHSALWLQQELAQKEHSTESKLAYWIWGAAATVGMSILIPSSTLPIRQKFYELFLVWHIVISILIVVGCYLHIYLRFVHQWGYETWVFVAMAVWGFDRLMRVLKLTRNGIRTAKITVIDDDYIKVDVEGVSGAGTAYLYFPTLTWRVWENHPFSVAATVLPPHDRKTHYNPETTTTEVTDIEKIGAHETSVSKVFDNGSDTNSLRRTKRKIVGLSFVVRTRGGLTTAMRHRTSLPVLVEAPYGSHPDLSAYSLLIGVAGGVGITAIAPILHSHPGRTKLLWGVRTSGIVEAMREPLAGIDKEIFIGQRINILEALERECAEKEKIIVVVSGPATMADEARMAVNTLVRSKGNLSIHLMEESFSW
ncbi:hypothetical protein E2P81_ATG00687 [Venturia nashicola]|uniref:Ferric oxidoreductase domain-containing protein n=1 Tax=Venturia nashicola TaxID=86259 RepID=A0A4Z1PEJ9_9PEZI|nr:hypothetical protein E6O75_ATG00698 [Venturia nashicola]TLD39700.1 hypothetical protein E2P81_ATG00687 [Venturia nashicola]